MKSCFAAAVSVLTLATTVECFGDNPGQNDKWIEVSGTGVHYFTTAKVYSQQPTETGFIQRGTETVELEGDLNGRVLYHPVSVFDFAAGTLVNTGHQVFSGTVLGSEPVLIHDEWFRFEVNLATGETVGEVYLQDNIAGPKVRCELTINSVGERTAAGDAVVDYTGRCHFRGESAAPAMPGNRRYQ
jgi:hypothetical protein